MPTLAPEGDGDALTFSRLSTNSRRWCSASNGSRSANTAAVATHSATSANTARRSARGPYRCANGSASGSVYAPVIATSDAMMCSAGASRPVLPACARVSQHTTVNDEEEGKKGRTHQGDEHVEHRADELRARQERHRLAQRVRPQ